MTVFHVAFVFILALNAITKCRVSERGRKVFCILSGTIYFLIAALRGYHVGFDTFNYFYSFKQASQLVFLNSLLLSSRGEPLFYGFLWLVSYLTGSFTAVLAIVALFFTVSVWLYIYRYSEDPFLSILMLLAFNVYQFSLTGMRQTMAMSFACLALVAMKERRNLLALFLILLGAQFHKTGYLFLVLFPLKKYKLSINMLYLSVVALVGVFLGRTQIASLLIPYINERGYSLSLSSSGYTMAFVIFMLYLCCVVFVKEYKYSFQEIGIEFWMLLIAVFFEMLVTVQNIFFRFAFYFLIGGFVLIPNVIASVHNLNSRTIIRMALYLLLSIQYLVFTMGSSGVLPYQFFWQG